MTETTVATRSVFVAGPFKNAIDPVTGLVNTHLRSRLEAVLEYFDAANYRIYNSHRRESWGAAILKPEQCTKLDYDEISDADLFVAFPGEPASPGTHIEMGWASSLGKPVILIVDGLESHSFLVRGLHTVATTQYIDAHEIPQLVHELDQAVKATFAST
jgi:nucleoside 2-deoxyribosyltransferase